MVSMSLRSSKYLAVNLEYLSRFQGVIAMALYSDKEYVIGDETNKAKLDAVRNTLLATAEQVCDVTLGTVTYRAQRIGDDQFVIAWQKGHPIVKSLMRAVDRAIKHPRSQSSEVAA
jgi:hypothetical protein